MATQSVKIPVELQIQQIGGQIAELKKALKGIKPESAAWSKLNGVIEKLESKFYALERHSRQTFSSTSEIKAFKREFDRLIDGVDSAADSFKGLKFKDLKINPEAAEGIQKLEKQIEKLKESFQSLEAVSIQNLINGEDGSRLDSDIKKLGLTKIPEQYDELIKAIEKKGIELSTQREKVSKETEKLAAERDKLFALFYEPFFIEGSDKPAFFDEDDLLQVSKLKELFNKYNEEINFEKGKLKKNVEQELSFDLVNLGFKKSDFEKLFSGIGQAEFEKSFNTLEAQALQHIENLKKAIDEKERESRSITMQQRTVKGAKEEATTGREDFETKQVEDYRRQVQELENRLKSLKQQQVAAADAIRLAGQVSRNTSQIQSQYTQQIAKTEGQLRSMEKVQNALTGIENGVKQWFGFNEVINLTKRIVRDAITEIKELDSVMTEIAVVTDMTQADLWAQMETYGAIAEQYGVSTRGVYEVSQLWYQQGLQTAEVMNLTTETLKMAKIANLDYATATDYMTVALRGFKLEMTEAQNVTDVYSALAAATASDTEELAIAMSKTASSAEAVGASFESTSAMIATMISITREAPENIGSALKSIISRYGEMTSDPLKLVDSEGEEMSLNKVDKALRSVGISLQDANGQFRAFDDVILELAESWDTIDTNTQRYIATIMAGNRQQSRFLALVGNVEAYKDALETAANAEDAGTLQYLKTMDSLETKLQQVKTAWTQFYSSMGLEELFKGALDIITNIIQSLNKMGKFDALMSIVNIFLSVKNIVSNIINLASKKIGSLINNLKMAKAQMEQGAVLKLQTEQVEQQLAELHQKVQDAFTVDLKINQDGQPPAPINKPTVPQAQVPVAPEVAEILKKQESQSEINAASSALKKIIESTYAQNRMKNKNENGGIGQLGQLSSAYELGAKLKLTQKEIDAYNRLLQESGIKFQNTSQFLNDFGNYLSKTGREAAGTGSKLSNLGNKALEAGKSLGGALSKLPGILSKYSSQISTALATVGASLTAWGLATKDSSEDNKERSKIRSGWGTALSSLGSGISTGAMIGGPWGAAIGAIAALPGVISGLSQVIDGQKITTEERIEMLTEELKEAEEKATIKKGDELNLKNSLDEFYKLEEAQYDSAEATQAFTDKMNAMGEQYPQLIESMDASGNAIIDANAAEQMLMKARLETAQATLSATETEYKKKETERQQAEERRAVTLEEIEVPHELGEYLTLEEILGVESIPEEGILEVSPEFVAFMQQDLPEEVAGRFSEFTGTQVETGVLGLDFLAVDTHYLTEEGIEYLSQLRQKLVEGTISEEERHLLGSLSGSGLQEGSKNINFSTVTLEELEKIFYNGDVNNVLGSLLDQAMTLAENYGLDWTIEDLGFDEFGNVESVQELFDGIQTIKNLIDQQLLSTGEALSDASNLLERNTFKEELISLAALELDNSEYINNYSLMLEQLGTEMTKHFLGIGSEGNIQEYAQSEDQEMVAQYNEAHNQAFEQLKLLIASGSEDFVNFYNNLDSVRDVDEIRSMVESLGFTGEDGEAIYEALVSTYSQYTDAARERALAAIRGSENLGPDSIYFSQLFNQNSGLTELTSQYSDHVVKTVKQIDDYAERGLANRANLLTSITADFYNELGKLDGETQGELFDIIRNINWSDASSIAAARSQLENYISNQTGDTTQLEQVLSSLTSAQEELFFNVTSTVESYRQAIIDSIEGTTENYSGLTEGFEIGAALEKFNSLTAVAGYEDFTFDQLFTFDQELGKYVYSLSGFNAAMKAQQDKLTAERAIVDAAIANINNLAGEDGLFSLFKAGTIAEEDIYSAIQTDGADSFIQGYFELPDNMGEEQLAALEDIISRYNPQIHGSFENYLSNYTEELNGALDEAEALQTAANAAYLAQLRSSLDLEGISSGLQEDNQTQRNILTQIAEARYAAGEIALTAEQSISELVDEAMAGNTAVLEGLIGDFTYEEELSLLESQSSNFKNALSQAINEPGTALSEAEGLILSELGLAELRGDIWYTVSEVRDFTQAIEALVTGDKLTLQEANQLLADIYTEQNKVKATKADFSSKTSLNYSDLAELATIQGEKLSEEYITSLGNAITQDSFTGNFEVVNFDAYWTMLHGVLNKNTTEYLEAYSNWVEDQISKNSQVEDAALSELEALMGAKLGEQLSVVYLENIIGDLSEFGLNIQNGIATITDDAQIYDLVQAIVNTENIGSTELRNSITSLKDSLNEMFENWANLIGNGIEGSLNYAGAEQLMTQFDFLSESDFTKTQEGLKLSRDSAFQLYQELKKIDSIKAGLVFDSLAESLAEAGDGYEDVTSTMASIAKLRKKIADADDSVSEARLNQYKQELATAEEILKVRSEDPDSYNFMDEDLGILEGPLNYWNNVGEGFKALNDGVANGYMDVQDYVNIIRETASLVEAAGGEFEVSGMNASQLIQAGLNAMENVDGEGARINIEGLGINFAEGTESLKGQFNDGIANLAESQIEMIDAQIQLLETIIAMEEISDIDIDGDGIELGELFELNVPEDQADGWEDVIDWSDRTKKALTTIRGKLRDPEGSLTELGLQFQEFKINSHSLLDIIESTPQDLQAMGFSLEQSLAIFQSIEKMVESGDYDLDKLLTSISDVLGQSFSGSGLVLDFGGKTFFATPEGLAVEINWEEVDLESINLTKEGAYNLLEKVARGEELPPLAGFKYEVLIGNAEVKVDEEGNEYYTYKGQTLSATSMIEAAQEIALIKQGGLDGTSTSINTEAETLTVTGELKLGEVIYSVSSSEEGVTITDPTTKKTYTGANLAEAKEGLLQDKILEAQQPGGSGKTEAEIREELGMTLTLTPNAQVVSNLTPVNLQELATAYLSGNNEGFLSLAMDLGIIPQDLGIESGSEVSQEQINALAADLGISSMPIPVNISFSGVTAEEATSLASSIENIATYCSTISALQFGSFSTFISALQGAFGGESGIVQVIQNIKQELDALVSEGYIIDLTYNVKTQSDQEGTYSVTVEDAGAAATLGELATALLNVNTNGGPAIESVSGTTDAITAAGDAFAIAAGKIAVATSDITSLGDAAAAVPDTGAGKIDNLNTSIGGIPANKGLPVKYLADAMNKIPVGRKTLTVDVKVSASGDGSGSATGSFKILKTGNVALAKGTQQGPALAGGRRTLMGELGPELVVSNGRYFTVGNNGAEFVDLPSDAIVFNHLQTKKLLGSGGMVGTGEPVTNERNAVAFASGNVSGPAMASAQQALDELYALRAMWSSLLDATASDLGKKAGRAGQGAGGKGPGSGGGGGGGGGGGSGEDTAAVLADLERWYNLLRQIEKLEQQITYEQAKRENMRNGYDYSASLQKELKLLKKQRDANRELAEEQKKYYDQRRADLNATDYSKIFTYDEDGLMQYVEQDGMGLDILAKLNETDVNGKAKMDAKEQLAYLKSIGFDISTLKTNADGSKAEKAEDQMQNFWDGIDGWMEEMDSLYDSYNDAAIATEEATAKMNEILQEYIDNQLEVEQKLLKAIEDREQAEIDRIQEEKDLLEEAAQEYIDGLSEALDKERSLYEKNETDAETSRLQRQLAILQRSGGSASEIKSLQDQIDSRLKDAYFQEQQDQIDAIQKASDNQIEKLQSQIDIMTEALEYQKENGLLWNEVYTMMQTWTPEAMLQFIQEFTKEQQENSPTQNEEDDKETLDQLQMYAVERDWKEYYDRLEGYSDAVKEEHKVGAYEAFAEAYETGGETAAIAAANEYYKQATTAPPETPPTDGGGGSNPPEDTKKKIQFNRGSEQYWTYKNSKREGKGQIFYGNKKSPVVEVVGETDSMYQISGKDGKGTTFTNRWISKKTSKKKDIWKAYKTGGLVDYTGPAWVDGSKRKPEAFLSASDTAMLKSKIFSNSDGSLKALVAALEEITGNTSRYSAQTNTESIVIQNAQVNIQPGVISNDYDARRAGEMALEEMVKIARKTTNRVISR